MNRSVFERLVTVALESLPPFFQEKLDNLAVVVEDWPNQETMRRAGVHSPAELLGFYHGVPQTKRTRHYGLIPPDKITIYQRPIEMRCRTTEEVVASIRRVLRHEIAHHFGLDDERLREIGAY
jgi:predicted Zn-dependent protease with MMP-like domain